MTKDTKQIAEVYVKAVEGKSGKALEVIAEGFIHLLHQERLLDRFHDIVDAINDVWRERYGVGTVQIQTAYPLPNNVREKIESITAGASLKENVNTDLIGGAKIRIDDRVIDGSVAGHLQALKEVFMESIS